MKTKIILDTNFLLIPAQFKVDIFSEIKRICDFKYELVVVAETVTELKDIIGSSSSGGKDKKAAKLALQLLKKFEVKVVKNYRKVFKRADEAILDIADKKSFVATQDRELKRLLRAKTRLIILRKKQYLQICE